MNRLEKGIITAVMLILIPAIIASGQEKKNEQRIKVVVAEDGSSKVLLDTLISGESAKDTIILKGGKQIFLTRAPGEALDSEVGSKEYVITTTVSDDSKSGKKVKKEVRVISSDGCDKERKTAHCEALASGKNYSYSYSSDNDKKELNSENAKYVISRDGLKITVEGSDYDKVRAVVKDIEKNLDGNKEK